MNWLLILLYCIVNIYIVNFYKNKYEGVFSAPFIMAAISLSVMLPQMTTIYYSNRYDNDLIPLLAYIMISCNIAFAVGYKRGYVKVQDNKFLDIRVEKIKYIVLLSSIAGCFAFAGIGDGVITALFMAFSQIAICFSLISFLNNKRVSKIYLISFILGCIIVLNYIFFIYGSRGSALFLFLALLYSAQKRLPRFKKSIRYIVVFFLLVGSIVSASISAFRQNLHGGRNEIDYWDNFIYSFKHSDTDVGMDLGNAALLIDYCHKYDSYNYGTIFWDSFVYNFVPARLVGEDVKYNLQNHPDYDKYIEPITNGITTVTGYFEAYATWGMLGFLTFYFIGYVCGFIWSRAKYSNLYLCLLLYSLGNVPLLVTHNLQYVLSRWERIAMFVIAFCWWAVYKNDIKKLNMIQK